MGSDVPSSRVLIGGGIGAGKSTLLCVLEERGFHSIVADAVGAEVLAPGTQATRAVEKLWPDHVANGVVDRAALAKVVFADADALRALEAVTHPAIVAEIEKRVAGVDGDVVVEIPLLRMKFLGRWLRIAVVAGKDVRIDRAVQRGGDRADVRRRVAAQVSDEEWRQWADVVIDNNGDPEQAADRVRAIVDEMMP